MNQFRVALAQMEPYLFSKKENLIKVESMIRQAAAQKSSVVIFPELCLTGYSLGARGVEMAELPDGQSSAQIARLASRYNLVVVIGYAESSTDGNEVYDSALVIDQKGKIAGSYRKIHLYADEKQIFSPGSEPLVVDLGFGLMGVLICYDLEFPEAARELALRGVDWIAVCTGSMVPNQHIQELYVQTRAAENRIWVVLTNRVGKENDLDFFGASAAADPYGDLIVRADDQERLIVVDLDLDRSIQARKNADYLLDRKSELYSKWRKDEI